MTVYIDDDVLDNALRDLLAGGSAAEVLASHPAEAPALAPLLRCAVSLDGLRSVQAPSSESLAADRNEFLAQISELPLKPVSAGPLARLKGWIAYRAPWLLPTATGPQKETRNMFALALKLGLIITIVAGSLGGTLAAAAESLPGSAVYPIKLAMEQAQLSLRNDPAGEAEQYLVMAQERVREMVQLATNGQVPNEGLMTRLQSHMRHAYQSAAQANGQQMTGLLVQAKTMTQTSEQALAAGQEGAQQQLQERLQEARRAMNVWQGEAEAGLEDAAQFRFQYGPGGPCGDETCQPPYGQRRSAGDGESQQHQYGPVGPCSAGGCEPPYGQGAGDGEQQQHGSGSPCVDAVCEPAYGAGEQYQYGIGDEGEDNEPPYGDGDGDQHQHGPGGPGEAEECEPPCGTSGSDAEGDGEQHQYGPGEPSEGQECQSPTCNSDQLQQQNQEQNQNQGDTQNQEQNGDSEGSGDSGGAGGADGSGGSSDTGNTGEGGGSNEAGGSDGPGGSGNTGGSGGGNG